MQRYGKIKKLSALGFPEECFRCGVVRSSAAIAVLTGDTGACMMEGVRVGGRVGVVDGLDLELG